MDAKGAKWVLVSNYREIRLYAVGYGRKDYEKFDLSQLSKPEQYKRFILLLSAENLLGERTFNLLKESENKDKEITDKLYKDYKDLRSRMIETLTKDNPAVPVFDIIQHTQTILDRILFVAFAEDRGLLPDNTLKRAYETHNDFNPQPVWGNFKGLFHAIDKGSPPLNITGYNGGLFAENTQLNSLLLSDSLCQGFKKIGEYDFQSDVSVNILGHIFEQSITDLEEIKANVSGAVVFDKKKSKRKKDGIFYTPPYITRYIVEQAVGGWLNDRKQEIGFDKLPELTDDDYATIKNVKGAVRYNAKIEKHVKAWEAYKKALSNIKVLDPACGSGAFLNEVFDYLFREGQTVNSELTTLNGNQAQLFRWDKHILANNIYGVDINQESVEITKLSLWLKTANKGEKLTYLDNNIKCGNSLIDDSSIAGDLAFNWEKEFADIMKNGGFDAVIGNPPYGAKLEQHSKEFVEEKYKCFKGNFDIYSAFIEKAFLITKQSGYWGYINPVTWQSGYNYLVLRQEFEKNCALICGIKLPYDTFDDAYVDTGIYIAKKELGSAKVARVFNFPLYYKIKGDLEQEVKYMLLPAKLWQSLPSKKIVFNPNFYSLTKKFKNSGIILDDISESVRGILSSDTDIKIEPSSLTKPYLVGNIYRYNSELIFKNVIYGDNLKEKPKSDKFFKGKRILIRRIINRQLRLMATYVDNDFVNKKDIYNLIITDKKFEDEYVLGIINSKLLSYLITTGSTASTKDDFSQITLDDIRSIRIIKAEKNIQVEIKNKVKSLIGENINLFKHSKKLVDLLKSEFMIEKTSANLEQWYTLSFAEFMSELTKLKKVLSLKQKAEWMEHFEKQKAIATAIKTTIDTTDYEIDQMVYALYSLTPEEITIVEG